MPTYKYGPPMSDSDSDGSDYDGFHFGDNIITKEIRRYRPPVAKDKALSDAIVEGNMHELRKQIELLNWNIDAIVMGRYTLLLHACQEGHYEIARYLIEELGANVNAQVDSITPLMSACDCFKRDSHVVELIVRLLLEHGAVINISDKYGTTPFMNACRNGFTNVVRLLINDVSFDAVDNQGSTAIFHAIQSNHADIVKILVEAGVNTNLPNCKGYTPLEVAEFHGFYDLRELLPSHKNKSANLSYKVPTQFLVYNRLCDLIPRIFLKSECPEYFQEVYNILMMLNMQHFVDYFAKEHISLAQFLLMNDEKLEAVGIVYPIYHSKIRKGILDFHLHHWSKKSISRIRREEQMDNFYEILMLTANHLQHLVIIQASLKFIAQNQNSNLLGDTNTMQLAQFRKHLMDYRKVVHDLTSTTKYLSTFSPERHSLYINFDEILLERKRNKVRKYFKYTTLILGISVFICLKVKRFF